jgi:hypothetical protein
MGALLQERYSGSSFYLAVGLGVKMGSRGKAARAYRKKRQMPGMANGDAPRKFPKFYVPTPKNQLELPWHGVISGDGKQKSKYL